MKNNTPRSDPVLRVFGRGSERFEMVQRINGAIPLPPSTLSNFQTAYAGPVLEICGHPAADVLRLINLWQQLVGPDQPLGVIPEGMALKFTTGLRASMAFPNPVRPDDTTCPGVTRGPAACTCNRVTAPKERK